jgi:hypothetical protein
VLLSVTVIESHVRLFGHAGVVPLAKMKKRSEDFNKAELKASIKKLKPKIHTQRLPKIAAK